MRNHYISRYAKFDTNFERTDPFKHASWKEDSDGSIIFKCAAGIGFILTLALIVIAL